MVFLVTCMKFYPLGKKKEGREGDGETGRSRKEQRERKRGKKLCF